MNKDIQLQLFKDFIVSCTVNAKSVKNYSDFKRINECLALLFPDKQDVSILDFDDAIEFEKIVKELEKQKEYIEINVKGKNQYSTTVGWYQRFLNAKSLFSKYELPVSLKNECLAFPLQTIYYGAPGTGKSYEVNRLTKGDDTVIRTTFHPDSDYASFVGCYKPIEVDEKRTFVYLNPTSNKPELMDVVNVTGDVELDKEKKITYKFTKQAFFKAYIQAWEKMCRAAFPMSIAGVCFSASGKSYTVKSVETDKIVLRFVREISKKDVEKRWRKRLSSGTFEWPNNNMSSDTQIDSICKWIFETLSYSETQLPEDWWENVLSKLEEDVNINGKTDTTVYVLNKKGEKIFIANDDMFCKKETLQEYYNDESKDGYESYSKVAGILRGINPDDFEAAWQGLEGKVENTNQCTETNAVTPQYLVIEEINRGNCAQIFGDIFQLLDRNDYGFSTYPIVPDEDITKELKKVFKDLNLFAVEKFINGIFSENYPSGIVDRIKSGELLVLPRNLFILATMNTSDQSLFPMDSAFKRRWEWEYVPITNAYKKKENGEIEKDSSDNPIPLGWKIKLDDNHELIDWWEFLQRINEVVAELTTSEDKQLGYFFTKPNEQDENGDYTIISADRFVSKVIFYLWNDVFKDYGYEPKCCKDKEEKKDVLYAKFYKDDKSIDLEVLKNFFEMLQKDQTNKLLVEKGKAGGAATLSLGETEILSGGEENGANVDSEPQEAKQPELS